MDKIRFTKNQQIFALIFIALSLLASKINFTPILAGDKLNFNVFDLYAPVAGGLFGSIVGVGSVLVVGLINLVLGQSVNLSAILHIFPVLFGTLYFSSSKKPINISIPLIAILGFLATPVGREVWYYPMFWLIPIIMSFFKEKSLLANALGATFTTHAMGGLLWINFFPIPASVWTGLIPIVIMERAVFTITTAGVFLLVQKVKPYFSAIPSHQNPPSSAA